MIVALAAFAAAAASQAQVSGTMQVQLNLVDGCIVSGSSDPLNAVNFGVMDFGSAPTLFANSLQALAMIGGAPTQLVCSEGASLNIRVGDGNHAGSGVRRMNSGANYVQYRLFTQPGGAGSEYAVADAVGLSLTVPAGGAPFNLPIHGLVAPQSGLVAGAYSDTVTVTLNF
ncbi:MAG: spore coat U domain-containing protein [Burkholderiaceae bacterium]